MSHDPKKFLYVLAAANEKMDLQVKAHQTSREILREAQATDKCFSYSNFILKEIVCRNQCGLNGDVLPHKQILSLTFG